MKICIVFLFLFQLTGFVFTAGATNYYINTVTGKDSNKGTTNSTCWKTSTPLRSIRLMPGDSILFASGQQFTGMLSLVDVKGVNGRPIVISAYQFKNNKAKPVIDAGADLNALYIQNASFIHVAGIEFTAVLPYQNSNTNAKTEMRCGILVNITKDDFFESILFNDVVVHDVYYNVSGFTRSAAEVKSANGTQSYGWGIRVINNTKAGRLKNVKILAAKVYNVSHTGIKATASANGIQQLEIAECNVSQTGGPGMQFSGVTDGHIHHNKIDHSGSTADSRNWGRGSGLWTWSCSNILIEHNRFEYANGPGDSAGVHIDYNCNDVIVQYNLSAYNASGFCEILGNNYNCAYRYNISVNDGYRVKGENGAFHEGKIFWLSGYQGNEKKNAGPYNSYFYNNTIYVSKNIIPKIAVSSSADGVLIANNIFYFEAAAKTVIGDQKQKEVDVDGVPNVVFKNNLFLRPNNWPADFFMHDAAPVIGDPVFLKKGGIQVKDYTASNRQLIADKGIPVDPIPGDSIGLRIGLNVMYDILGNKISGNPDLGAIELGGNEKR